MPPRHELRWLQSGFLPNDATSEAWSESSLLLTPCRWQPTPIKSSSSSSSSTNTSGQKKFEVSAVHGGGLGFGLASDQRGDLYVWGDCQDYLLPQQNSPASLPSSSPGMRGGSDAVKGEEGGGSRGGEGERGRHDRVLKGVPNDGGRVVDAHACGGNLRLLMRAREDDDDDDDDDDDGGDDDDNKTVAVVAAAAGWAHVVAVAAAAATSGAGPVRCAGWNSHGQAPERSAFNDLVNVRSLAAGERHTLAVCGDGRAWAWGDNSCGQLGLGCSRGGIGCVSAAAAPAAVNLASAAAFAVVVAAGARHSIVIDAHGTVYTFGWGLYGQCGHGDSEDVYAPTPCRHLLGIPCRAAAAGSAHTAVVTRDLGGLYTFGSNQFGQLGCVGGEDGGGNEEDGDAGDDAFCEVGGTSATPLLIDLVFDDDDDDGGGGNGGDKKRKRKLQFREGRGAKTSGRVLEVSCGSRHTAAVVACVSDAPAAGFNDTRGSGGCVSGGREGAGAGAGAEAGSGGDERAGGRAGGRGGRETTRLFAWGWNAHGQLGLGDRRDRWAPRHVAVPPADDHVPAGDATVAQAASVAHVSCGWWHTVVGVNARERGRE